MPEPNARRELHRRSGLWSMMGLGVRDGVGGFGRFATTLLILAFLMGLVWFCGRQVLNEQIRRIAQQRLNDHYEGRGLRVEVGSARLLNGTGLEFNAVRFIGEPAPTPGARLLTIDRVLLRSDVTIWQLVQGQVDIERIEIDGLRARLGKQPDGQINLSCLFPLPRHGSPSTPIRISRSQLIIAPIGEPGATELHLHNVHGAIDWPTVDPPNEPQADRLVFRGSFSSERAHDICFDGELDFAKRIWGLRISGRDLRVDDQLLRWLPSEMQPAEGTLEAFQGELTVGLAADGDFDMETLPRFRIGGRFRDGRVADGRLPDPVDRVEFRFWLDNDGFRLWDVHARWGDGWLSGDAQGRLNSGELQASLIGTRLRLGPTLEASLPANLRQIWSEFNPQGLVNVEATWSRDSRGLWDNDVLLELLDVTVKPRAFPYRIDGCNGIVRWRQGRVEVDCRALASGRILSVEGTYFQDPRRPSEIVLRIPKPIPIDERLMQAVATNPNLLSALRSFRPAGMITCEATLDRHPELPAMRLKRLQVEFRQCSIDYERFRYPLNRITGMVVYEDPMIYLRSLQGENDGGTVLCDGIIEPDGTVRLGFIGSAVPLDEELRQALSPALQDIWASLRPQGSLDHLMVGLEYDPRRQTTLYDVRAEKYKTTGTNDGRGLSLHPTWLPIRLQDVSGILRVGDGGITIEEMRAQAGPALFTATGRGAFDERGWFASLDNLAIDALQINEEFLDAMPASFAESIRALGPTGEINVLGRMRLSSSHDRSPASVAGPHSAPRPDPIELEWDVTVDMEHGTLRLPKPIEHIHGGVRLTGHRDATGTFQSGVLSVDSMFVDGVQLTNLEGPFRIDPTQILFGSWANPEDDPGGQRPITARLFGGRLACDAVIATDRPQRFHVQAWLEEADIALAARELSPGVESISGRAYGFLNLIGDARGPASYQGEGMLRLVNADIYEIPVMLSLLKVISIKQPDRTGFTNCNVDFRVFDEHLYFDRLEFIGDAISLKGNGEMDYDGRIDLQFYTMVGRDEWEIPIISPLFGAASQNFLLIDVDGTISDPELNNRHFPALNETLQQIFPEAVVPGQDRILPGIPGVYEPISAGRSSGGARTNRGTSR